MLGKFWEGIGGKLADRWLAIAVPAGLFWLGGGLAWLYRHRGTSDAAVVVGALSRQSPGFQLLVLVGALTVVAASGVLVDRLTDPALRVVEGCWHPILLRFWPDLGAKRRDMRTARWQELGNRMLNDDLTLTPEDHAEFLKLDRRRRREPVLPHRRLPTKVGNILRSAESRPYDRYGLDVVAVWPRLWLLLPEATKRELIASRRAVNSSVVAALWGLMFIVFTLLAVWALPIGLLIVALALKAWLPARAEALGDLVEATLDVHRSLLYQQFRWPLPASPAEELIMGKALTKYLWRGSDSEEPMFTPPA